MACHGDQCSRSSIASQTIRTVSLLFTKVDNDNHFYQLEYKSLNTFDKETIGMVLDINDKFALVACYIVA